MTEIFKSSMRKACFIWSFFSLLVCFSIISLKWHTFNSWSWRIKWQAICQGQGYNISHCKKVKLLEIINYQLFSIKLFTLKFSNTYWLLHCMIVHHLFTSLWRFYVLCRCDNLRISRKLSCLEVDLSRILVPSTIKER